MQEERPRFHTKRELAVLKMKDAILLGHYRPGQSLRQVQLMADLDLGATPAREAALELVARGLLVHESHRGVRVADLDVERAAHVYQVRALLESEAARLAAANATRASTARLARHARAMESAFKAHDLKRLAVADERFHRTLCEGANNPVLLKLIEQLWELFPRYMLWRNPARIAQSLGEHREIARRFAQCDADGAARAVREHILNGLAALDAILREEAQEIRSKR
ncbi:MAG: GntR family transcriptional regulator [Rudaea sp.]